jgi:hypothetical protein
MHITHDPNPNPFSNRFVSIKQGSGLGIGGPRLGSLAVRLLRFLGIFRYPLPILYLSVPFGRDILRLGLPPFGPFGQFGNIG